METYFHCANKHLPHHLNDEESASPKLVIKDHFSYAHLDEWRQILWLWLNAVMTNEITCIKLQKPYNSPSAPYYDKKLLEKLIEASSLLATTGQNHLAVLSKEKAKRKHRIKTLKGRKNPKLIEIKEALHVIQFLNDEEIGNPYLALASFFQYYSLDEWRYLQDDWLYYGLSKSANEGESWFNDTLYCYAQLVRLTEACFLINELENKDSS